jgi:hypothetical protein
MGLLHLIRQKDWLQAKLFQLIKMECILKNGKVLAGFTISGVDIVEDAEFCYAL